MTQQESGGVWEWPEQLRRACTIDDMQKAITKASRFFQSSAPGSASTHAAEAEGIDGYRVTNLCCSVRGKQEGETKREAVWMNAQVPADPAEAGPERLLWTIVPCCSETAQRPQRPA